jgi:hypothetical protein
MNMRREIAGLTIWQWLAVLISAAVILLALGFAFR